MAKSASLSATRYDPICARLRLRTLWHACAQGYARAGDMQKAEAAVQEMQQQQARQLQQYQVSPGRVHPMGRQ